MMTVLVFEGEYDLSLRKRMRHDIDSVRNEKNVILDLSAVSYCEASCLAEFVLLARDRDEQGASPVMLVPSAAIRRLFEITRLDGLFTIVESVADAVRDDTTAVAVRSATQGYESLFFRKPHRAGALPAKAIRSTTHGAVTPEHSETG
jgi:anti-sigma B factor antagonist